MPRQGTPRPCAVATALAVAAFALGGCSSVSLDELNPTEWFSAPSTGASAREGGFTVSRGAAAPTLRATTPSDLVGADGQCQGGSSDAAGPPRGVALTMTECELVAVAGVPEQVNIGANENGDRRSVLTYTKGDNSGVYTFVSGRLKIIERLPEPPKPERRRREPKRQRA